MIPNRGSLPPPAPLTATILMATASGLDYFGARYYYSSLGRWLTPDWSAAPSPVPYADLHDPQSLNLYGYVRNSPISRFDADGHDEWFANGAVNTLRNPFSSDHW